ncbi:MAG: hypothetical protein FOGNACKC_00719 [Anaerolineae bacterium]|nr:hypothetical protein [Anaerolineae bacterium]
MQLEWIPVDKIVRNDPVAQSKMRREALANAGMFDPIRVVPLDNGFYWLLDGRRRVNDSIENGETEVLALVEDPNEIDTGRAALIGLALNMSRSANYMNEARMMRVYVMVSALRKIYRDEKIPVKTINYDERDGYDIVLKSSATPEQQQLAVSLMTGMTFEKAKKIVTVKELVLLLGVSQGKISQRLRLLDLIPALQHKLESGLMSFTAARSAYKLPPAEQEKLARETEVTIDAAVEAAHRFEAANLPDDDFGVDVGEFVLPGLFVPGDAVAAGLDGCEQVVEWNGKRLKISIQELGDGEQERETVRLVPDREWGSGVL